MNYEKELNDLLTYWQHSNLPEGEWQKAMLHHAEWMRKNSAESLNRESEHRWTSVSHACKCFLETGSFHVSKKEVSETITKINP